MSKFQSTLIIFAFILANSLTCFLTTLNGKIEQKEKLTNQSQEFQRAAIKAGVAGYNEFLDFTFRAPNDIAMGFILKMQTERRESAPVPAPRQPGSYKL